MQTLSKRHQLTLNSTSKAVRKKPYDCLHSYSLQQKKKNEEERSTTYAYECTCSCEWCNEIFRVLLMFDICTEHSTDGDCRELTGGDGVDAEESSVLVTSVQGGVGVAYFSWRHR